MAKLFLDERNLFEAGVSLQNILTIRKMTDFVNLVTQVQSNADAIAAQAAAIDATNEAVEDANLSLISLDGRIDTLETAAPTYVLKAGSTMTGALDVQALLRCDSFRVDQTPIAETVVCTHTVTISLDGTNYKLPAVAA